MIVNSLPKIRRRQVQTFAVEAMCGLTDEQVLCNGMMRAVEQKGKQFLHQCDKCSRQALYNEPYPAVDHVLVEGPEKTDDKPAINLSV